MLPLQLWLSGRLSPHQIQGCRFNSPPRLACLAPHDPKQNVKMLFSWIALSHLILVIFEKINLAYWCTSCWEKNLKFSQIISSMKLPAFKQASIVLMFHLINI